jgi:beta-N-acetylhexosaminidase
VLGPLVIDIEGTSLTPPERQRLRHPLVGQVVLFTRNFASPRQLGELTAEIGSLRDPPLRICVDHEGGRVQRFREGFSAIPAMSRLGALWDRDVLAACRSATSIGHVMASELRSQGVDLTFAPVLDLAWGRSGVIGDRALHSDPRVVTLLAAHLMHGFALAGMASCGKHFPGHGWAVADSHHEVPEDARPLRTILAQDAAPYGWLGVSLSSVMPAHVVYPQVDARPAGFSSRWIGEILRGDLGFAGAVFSDDLSMEGAGVAGDLAARATAALQAGCDFILVCNDPEGVDRLLGELRWQASGTFAQRLERIAPVGSPEDPQQWRRSAGYRAALRDLDQLMSLPA